MTLDDEGSQQALFRRSLSAVVDREVTPFVGDWEQRGEVPRALFSKLGELGFLAPTLSAEYGGGGLDFHYTTIFVEELMRCGAVGVPVSLLAHAEFSTKVIDRAGSPQLKARFVRPAARGDAIGALGVSEPDAGSDVAAIRTRAVADGDDFVINGAKTFISNGTIADFVTTAVRTGGPGHGGISLIVVPTDCAGFSAKKLEKVGTHASDTAEITFTDCRVPATNLIGARDGGFALIMEGFRGERLILAVIAGALMSLMWREARRYGHQREISGKPLLGFQTWRHRLADARTTIAAARALTNHAIGLYVAGRPCDSEISMAKLFATESVALVRGPCAQIFGAMGYMNETLMARLVRDSLALTVGAGTSEVMREIIARHNRLVPGEPLAD